MAGFIKRATVTIPPYSTSGARNQKMFAQIIVKLVCDALMDGDQNMYFVDAQGQSVESIRVDNVGTYTGTDYGLVSTQIYDSASDCYIRVWMFQQASSTIKYIAAKINDTEQESGTYSGINIYSGNITKTIVSNSTWYYEMPYDIFFGVKHGAPIGVDPGYDLNLDIPLFGFSHERVGHDTGSKRIENACFQSTGATITFIVKGTTQKTIIGKLTQNDINNVLIYGDELLNTVNPDDQYKRCVLTQYAPNGFTTINFSLSNSSLSNNGFIVPFFKTATGKFAGSATSFKRVSNIGNSVYVNSTASKFVYSAVYASEISWEYQDSGELAGEGIAIKGWIDSDVLRYAYSQVIPQTALGTTYSGGDFVVIGQSTLIGWDASNSPLSE